MKRENTSPDIALFIKIFGSIIFFFFDLRTRVYSYNFKLNKNEKINDA